MIQILPGAPYPLGANFLGNGTNFSIFSEVAERVELCLFDEQGEETRINLPEATGYCWHGFLPDVKPGQRYGFRVHGPWEPHQGHRCNPNKLLIDPYTKVIDGEIKWDDAVFPYPLGGDPTEMDERDSAPFIPKCVVHDAHFDWEGDKGVRTPWHKTITYETHVKGFTARHPDIPEDIRGTYAGLAHPAAIEYLKQLGITAVELLPVHQFVNDQHLSEKGLRNYWGYNSIGYLAPHRSYASEKNPAAVVAEFKTMVKALHKAGIGVILDVVYNHTAEGNHLGPMLSFKGIDNVYYYRTMDDDPQYYMDYTGCGNSLNMRGPHVLQLIMDSLRFWVEEMHVDGFRFDLASALARELHDVDKLSAFFDLIQQDPVISQVKLIAEPWDIGEGGYQVGNFPPVWTEWNGKYRDCVRDFWRGQEKTLGDFASRFTGSSDLYANNSRRPYASINFITAHDGFSLRDLVSYNEKHNEANGEDNRDGDDHNRSWNCGAEGETDDEEVLALRGRQQRNFLTTLILSQGVPMLLGGDEMGRTQGGNNNAYCQDNEISWYDWSAVDEDLLDFTRELIKLRREHPVFCRRRWFHEQPIHGKEVDEILWFAPAGEEMEEEHWGEGVEKALAIYLNGQTKLYNDPFSDPVADDSFYLIMNAHHESVDFTLPTVKGVDAWVREFDTDTGWARDQTPLKAGQTLEVKDRCFVVLRHGI